MRRLFFADVLLFVRKFCMKNEKKKENSENSEKILTKRIRYSIISADDVPFSSKLSINF